MGRGVHINVAQFWRTVNVNLNSKITTSFIENNNMFVKLAVIACSLAFASAAYNGPLAGGQPASLYPAGVDPKSCPNYPNCANPAVAVNQIPETYQAQQYQPAPQYQSAPQYQPQQYSAPVNQYNSIYPQQYSPATQQQYSSDIQSRLNRGEYIGDGDYRGEGLAEALAPGYAGQQAYASPAYNQVSQYSAPAYNPAAPQYAPQQPAQLPAGLAPGACPNYPFCH